MANTVPPQVLQDLQSAVAQDVAAGFLAPDEIAGSVVELFADDADPESLRVAADCATAEALQAHFSAQADWPAVTDCDRLDAAFEQLEALGIIARQNFSCCGTCGAREIVDEMAAARKQGRLVRGYTFFHVQDTESATQGHGLCLNYGTARDDEAAALAIAGKVVDILAAHGLSTMWDGTWNQRISVQLDWKRRRSAPSAA